MNRYWWSHNRAGFGIFWTKWQDLCKKKEAGGLGFRRMHDFNRAMLARQGWRLLTQLDSLCARVIKHKYYHNTDFFQADLGSSPSLTWRSILEGRTILAKGIRWRIGSGESINVWRDPWLPGAYPFRPYGPAPYDASHLRVSDLLLEGSPVWNHALLQTLFSSEEITRITSLRLSRLTDEDVLLWNFESDGEYSVKSGYHLLQYHENDEVSPLEEKMWTTIWGSPILKKTKIFIWRLFRRCLPTRKELVRRYIKEDEVCPLCGTEAESEIHVIFKCVQVKQVWCRRGLHVISNSSPSDLSAWPQFLIDYQPPGGWEHVFIIAWTIWFHRNRVVHEQANFIVEEIIWQVEKSLNEAAIMKISGLDRLETVWIPPPRGWMKLNTDAAVGNSGWIGIAAVLRDHDGNIKAAMASSCPSHLDVFHAECLALNEGLRWLRRFSLNRIYIEADAMNVIGTILSGRNMRSEAGILVAGIKDALSRLELWQVQHCYREGNEAAHKLAQHALPTKKHAIWI